MISDGSRDHSRPRHETNIGRLSGQPGATAVGEAPTTTSQSGADSRGLVARTRARTRPPSNQGTHDRRSKKPDPGDGSDRPAQGDTHGRYLRRREVVRSMTISGNFAIRETCCPASVSFRSPAERLGICSPTVASRSEHLRRSDALRPRSGPSPRAWFPPDLSLMSSRPRA